MSSDDRAGELHKGNPFGKALDEACVKAGIPRITPHDLRHTGNDLLRRFASREVVMAITGHSTPAMHSHYSHVDPNEKAEAVGKVTSSPDKGVCKTGLHASESEVAVASG